MKRSLLGEVSISEMRALREQGASNKEIAESLDVSYATVYTYIGKQPNEITRKTISEGMRKKHAKAATATENPTVATVEELAEEIPACLTVTSKVYEVEGTVGKYTLKRGVDAVQIELKQDEQAAFISMPMPFVLKFDVIDDFVRELQAIQRNAKKLNGDSEMW